MRFEAPALPGDAPPLPGDAPPLPGDAPALPPPVAPALPADAPAPRAMTVDEAVALYRARHAASARLLQRNPPGRPCDLRDVAVADAARLACDTIPAAVVIDAWPRWQAEHPCRALESCPLGPSPRGGRR